ncbi:beta-ketoacyl-ACP synthase III [Clostridium butyricum]|jgi:3-oxoacyl-[acyl-carrier-protein] synthase-3|uniref:Beta-ketoacyl-[acyl-carrier-protein] synthase III n=1 Tax=Clostridium butyricum TaxID=1492 RepID=A0A2S7FDN9_CLOBU|nr:beta-ketoacyl-ACP synthase III [Clostridium butyricum]ETI87445.1 MAG: 3-oxoacyl-[acyl-carrier-protein] synthase 3 [Clostridium butyricum DORA_1]KHD15600.1 3-oxoacyl-ACP synthase [Clostridium butyricum]MBZ0311641.1 ketoacyl-ACP synthase III [Clostridium butyricum]MDU1510097.1 beta-ketoacyl-ACP synthase III [Clostridium butyricum]MDU4801529.1 beta-ketoacyl-ACP synthase III [Clostridium butyricum]
MSNVGIAGTGAYVPSLAVTNDDISELVETNDEWIMKRTGIRERRISQGEDTSDMASKAALCALERADVEPKDVELIIVATISPDMFIPSVACLVQSKIGADDAACFDINVACSGFVYAMEIAQSMMKSMNYKNALIIGSETLSKVINWKDRSTCILFGDGAGAAVLKRTEEPGIMKSYLKSEGKKGDALTIGAADFNTPFSKESVERDRHIYMNGGDVLKFAVNALADSVNKVLDETGLSMDDIKYIVPHQANVRIIQSAAKKLHTDLDKFYINLEKYGNTSSASVPIALNEMYEKGMLKKGDKFILVAFGGGLTYAATMIEW